MSDTEHSEKPNQNQLDLSNETNQGTARENCDKDTDNTVKTNDIDTLLDTEFTVFSFITDDYEPGAVITRSELRKVFDENSLFNMNFVKSRSIKLRQLLTEGVITVGSVDTMETLTIVYPDQRVSQVKPVIKGRYMHGSREILISEKVNIHFDLDPASDHEYEDFEPDEAVNTDNNDKQKTQGVDLDWLKK
jgi:hypothetical protein